MKKRYNQHHQFLKDTNAVSEEFTALPALAVVMIGLTLFILLIANVYQAYEARIDSIKKYQTADFIATKLTNPDCPFLQEAGVVDYLKFTAFQNKSDWETIQDEYRASGVGFMLTLTWENGSEKVEPLDSSFNLSTVGNRVAVSRDLSIQLNPAITVPGKLTIITWSV